MEQAPSALTPTYVDAGNPLVFALKKLYQTMTQPFSDAPAPKAPSQAAVPQPLPQSGGSYTPSEEPSSLGSVLAQQGTPQPDAYTATPVAPVPQGSSGFDMQDPVTRIFLAQTGLNLLGGGLGNPLSRVAESVGAGGEAVGRYNTAQKAERDFVESQRTARERPVASARAKRLGKTSALEQATADMDPAAQLYLQARLKEMGKPDLLTGETADPTALFETIMQDTQLEDKKIRARKGRLRASEIPDTDIQRVLDNPTQEQVLLNAVQASPSEKLLLQQRLAAARAQTQRSVATAPVTAPASTSEDTAYAKPPSAR